MHTHTHREKTNEAQIKNFDKSLRRRKKRQQMYNYVAFNVLNIGYKEILVNDTKRCFLIANFSSFEF